MFDITTGSNTLEPKADLIAKRSLGLAKSNSLAGGANAPIINISSVSDEIPCCSSSKEEPKHKPKWDSDDEKSTADAAIDSVSLEPLVLEPLAPLAEPDSESPTIEFAASETEEKDEKKDEPGDEKANDVCPWEDE